MTPSFQGCLYWSLAQIRPGEDVLVEEEVDEEVDHHRYFFYNFKSDPVAMNSGAPIRSRIRDLIPNRTKVQKGPKKKSLFCLQVPNFSIISINERNCKYIIHMLALMP